MGCMPTFKGFKANVLLFQDYRRTGDKTKSFLLGASQKVFRGKKRYSAAFSDPSRNPPWAQMEVCTGAMILVHPHYTGRVVARFGDNRGI